MKSKAFSNGNNRLRGEAASRARAKRSEDRGLLAAQQRHSHLKPRNDLRPTLERVEIAIGALHAPSKDVRRHSPGQIAELVAAIGQYGLVGDVIVNADGKILNGTAVYLAAKQLGLQTLPCIRERHLTPAQEESFRIAVNAIGEKGSWNLDVLKDTLEALIELDEPILGFDDAELDLVMLGSAHDVEEGLEEGPADQPDGATVAVTKPGWMWQLGVHRVGCLDARRAGSYERLLEGRRARLCITDPPFNVRIGGHVSGLGSVTHREFVCASGELTDVEFLAFLQEFLHGTVTGMMDGGLIITFMDWRGLSTLLTAALSATLTLINFLVWAKGNAGMGSLWRSAHELMPVFKVGAGLHINQVQLGRNGRYRTNVWEYPGASTMGSEAREGLKYHPTVKPIRMIQDAILDVTQRGEIVLDPFLGSGTTVLAAERSQRACYGMELDPLYVDIIVRRWQSLTGRKAILVGSGQTFDELEAATSVQPVLPPPLLLLTAPSSQSGTSQGGSPNE